MKYKVYYTNKSASIVSLFVCIFNIIASIFCFLKGQDGLVFGIVFLILFIVFLINSIVRYYKSDTHQNNVIKENIELCEKIQVLLDDYKKDWDLYKDIESDILLKLVLEYVDENDIVEILYKPEKITQDQFKQMIDQQIKTKSNKINISNN